MTDTGPKRRVTTQPSPQNSSSAFMTFGFASDRDYEPWKYFILRKLLAASKTAIALEPVLIECTWQRRRRIGSFYSRAKYSHSGR